MPTIGGTPNITALLDCAGQPIGRADRFRIHHTGVYNSIISWDPFGEAIHKPGPNMYFLS